MHYISAGLLVLYMTETLNFRRRNHENKRLALLVSVSRALPEDVWVCDSYHEVLSRR